MGNFDTVTPGSGTPAQRLRYYAASLKTGTPKSLVVKALQGLSDELEKGITPIKTNEATTTATRLVEEHHNGTAVKDHAAWVQEASTTLKLLIAEVAEITAMHTKLQDMRKDATRWAAWRDAMISISNGNDEPELFTHLERVFGGKQSCTAAEIDEAMDAGLAAMRESVKAVDAPKVEPHTDKAKCSVRGSIGPGLMCGSVITGGVYCGYAAGCPYKVETTATAGATK